MVTQTTLMQKMVPRAYIARRDQLAYGRLLLLGKEATIYIFKINRFIKTYFIWLAQGYRQEVEARKETPEIPVGYEEII